MRFLYIAPRFHPNQYPIIEGLIRCGHEVIFCVSLIGETEKHDHVIVEVVNSSIMNSIVRKFLAIRGDNYAETKMVFLFIPKAREVKRILDKYNPDVVIMRDRNLLSLSFYQCAKKRNIRCILYNQSPIYTEKQRKDFLRKVWFSLFPKKRITICRHSSYPSPKKIYIQDINASFLPFVTRVNHKIEREYFLYNRVNIFDCGKYRSYKNHEILIRALAILRDRGYKNFHLTIVGQLSNEEEKNYYNFLQMIVIETNMMDYIDLKPGVPYDEIPQLYKSNDVYVLASSHEVANVSILDSMTYGLATIASSDNGTSDYIINNVTGMIFKSNDCGDLCEKLKIYLDSPDVVLSHGEAAQRAVISEFSFKNYYSRLMKVIDDL